MSQVSFGLTLAQSLESSVTSLQPEGSVATMFVAVTEAEWLVIVIVWGVPLFAVSESVEGEAISSAVQMLRSVSGMRNSELAS